MTDADHEPHSASTQEDHRMTSEVLDRVEALVDAGESEPLQALLGGLHPADVAEIITLLAKDTRLALIALIRDGFDPEIIPNLEEDVREEVLEALGAEGSAAAISRLAPDEAVSVLEDLDEEEQQEILEAVVNQDIRAGLEEGLAYPESSAGRLMHKVVVAVPEFWTVGDAIDFLRREQTLPEDFYAIFVIDPRYHPVGAVLLSRLLRCQRSTPVRDIMDRNAHSVPTTMDQEEVAYIFRKYALVSAPVVNTQGRVVGMITLDDIVHVIQEEAEEDLMKLGGVRDSGMYATLMRAASRRSPWLFFNLFTGFVETLVVGLFSHTIEHLVVLAALMPVVSALGGNVGTQSLTVVVRALATREITSANASRVVMREILICAINGILFGIVTGIGVALIYHDSGLGMVFGTAITANFCVAGIVGAMLPITMHTLKSDPAISSGIILTWITDVAGFSIFLGLATALLMHR